MSAVVIVDDHELLAQALRIALHGSAIDATCIAPRPAAELLEAIVAQRPELVLLDLDLGDSGDATALIAPLCRAGIRVLVVTGTVDPLRIAAALEQGAIGYRSKADGFAALVESTAAARSATGVLDVATRAELLNRLWRSRTERTRRLLPFHRLTEREQDTLRAMAQGRTVPEIAADWVVSEATVRTHVRGVLSKLAVRSQLAAVAAAMRSGWLAEVQQPAEISPAR